MLQACQSGLTPLGSGHERPWRLVLGVCLIFGCKPPAGASEAEGCTKDTDCKGDRICEAGACVKPPRGQRVDPKADVPMETSAKVHRGGPGAAVPLGHEGPASEPTQQWEVDLGAVVFATPTIAEGSEGPTAYVGTHAGRFVGVPLSGPNAGKVVLDLALGGRVWGRAAWDAERERLYVGDDDDHLHAIDPKENRILWSKRLGDCEPTRAPGPEGARCDVDGGPTLGPDGDLFVGADGLYRVSPEGEVRWHYVPEGDEHAAHVFSSPVLSPDGRLYFGAQDGWVTALDQAGAEQWRYRVKADVDGSGTLGPDGGLFIGADDGRLYALRRDGSLRWSFVAQRDIRSSVAAGQGGRLYTTSFDGNLYALEAGGEVAWVFPTGAPIHGSPVVDKAGRVYVGSQDDHLYALDPAGKVTWKLELPGDVDSSIALAEDGTLVVGCDDHKLRAFAPAP